MPEFRVSEISGTQGCIGLWVPALGLTPSAGMTMRRWSLRFDQVGICSWFAAASFFSDLADLSQIDWRILQAKDFRRDNEDLGKMERYQAEALVHRRVPISALSGIACYNDSVVENISALCEELGVEV